MHYPDTSFLVGLYLESDAHFPRANSFMARQAEPLAFTPLQRIELRNAIRVHAARGVIESERASAAIRASEDDLKGGFLVHQAANFTEVCRRADELSEAHADCRTLDLLHVAAALMLKADALLSFDERQRKLARAAGLKVFPR